MTTSRAGILTLVLVLPPLAVAGTWVFQLNGLGLDEPPRWLPWLSLLLSVDAGLAALSPWLWRKQIESLLEQRGWMAALPSEERIWRIGLAMTLYPLIDGFVLILLGGTLVQMMAFAGLSMLAGILWTAGNRL